MNKDQVKGRVKQVQGKLKEVAGKIAGDKSLELKGKLTHTAGKLRAGFGDLKDDLAKGKGS